MTIYICSNIEINIKYLSTLKKVYIFIKCLFSCFFM